MVDLLPLVVPVVLLAEVPLRAVLVGEGRCPVGWPLLLVVERPLLVVLVVPLAGVPPRAVPVVPLVVGLVVVPVVVVVLAVEWRRAVLVVPLVVELVVVPAVVVVVVPAVVVGPGH